MKIGFAGGAQEVGGSCICFRVGERGILMDAGIRQGGSRDPLPDLRLVQEMGGIDAILISHAHMDHIGSLPLISRAFPDAPIYMTPMTMDLTRVLLHDSLKIMSSREEEIPLYGEAEVSAMMDRIVPLNEQFEKEILPEITAVFYPAGHIAGAACIYLKTPEGTIFYSGDFATFPQQTIDGIHIPRLRPDISIVESTYGDRLHANRQVEEERLIRMVAEAVTAGKKVLIPSFALGRAQEVILLLRSGINRGVIPPVPVYVDGMVREICRIYHLHPSCLRNKLAKSIMKGFNPFYSKEVQPVLPSQDRGELVEKDGPAIFVASSGMLSGGPSVLYAEKIISREDGLVILTGYQDEEAPGRALMDLAEKVAARQGAETDAEEVTFSLAGRSIPVRANVCKVGLSAHGDQGEILNLLTKLSPRDVFLVHGDATAMPALARLVTGEHLRNVHLPRCGEITTVTYRTLRKQRLRNWPWTLGETGFPDESGMSRLRQFVLEHYPERQWTAMQLMEIWYGKPAADSSEITIWQQLLLDTAYFISEERHLFQFHPASDAELSDARKPRELTIQTIQELAGKHFSSFGYTKAGTYPEEKKLVLRFIFPDAVNQEAFKAVAELFEAETGWTVSIHPATNHGSAQQLLHKLLEERLVKISYFEPEKRYQVTVLNSDRNDSAIADRFKSETGWRLTLVSDNAQNRDTADKAATQAAAPAGKGRFDEQNAALSYVRSICAEEKIPLQKIGVKYDHLGKYMEMTFISPEIGRRYRKQIDSLSETVGWRLLIGNTVLQNQVLSIAASAAERAGLVLKKSPSYMPANREVQLKVQGVTPATQAAVTSEITEKTGLPCKITMAS